MSDPSIHRPRALSFLAAGLLALTTFAQARADTTLAPQTLRGEPVVQVAAGLFHSCALIQSGRVLCWGLNASGQLGNGLTLDQLGPTDVPGLTGVTQIAAAPAFNCALRSTGRVFCWGLNDFGQLGDGTTTNRLTPVRVEGLTGATRIMVGARHACALRDSGRVFCWGRNDSG